MRVLNLMWLLFFAMPAFAGPVNLSCDLPTENDDGSALTDLAGIKFFESDVSGGPYVLVGETSNPPVCAFVLERSPGEYFYVATAYNSAEPVAESVYSNETTHTVPPLVPAPPTGLNAAADQVAYAIQQFTDGLTVYPVALVDDITECDQYTTVTTAAHPMGLSLIPRDAVTFAPGADAYTVYAECSES